MWNRWSLASLTAGLMLAAAALPARSQNPGVEPGANEPARIEVRNCAIRLMQEVVLSPERPGVLGQIAVVEGDTVSEGMLLAKVKDDVPRAAFEIARKEAEADVDIRYAAAAAEVARAEYEKAREANQRKQGTVPEVELERARLAAEKSRLEIEKAQHIHEVNGLKRDEADVQLKTCRLEAPFSGFVSKVHVSRGATVRPGDPVIELIDISKLKVEGHVTLARAQLLRKGQAVEVVVMLKEDQHLAPKEVRGELKFIDARANATDNRVRIWAEVANPDLRLRAGWNATMLISVPEMEKAAP